MLSRYAKREWSTIIAIGVMCVATCIVVHLYFAAAALFIAAAALVLFFRDPERRVPTQRGVYVSPADGRVSSIHQLEHYEPLGGPAVCVRVFLSVLDVHVNRSPCHAIVDSVAHKPGDHLNALNPASADANESVLIILNHPLRRVPIAAVRQVAGLLARTIVCGVKPTQMVQRGQRIGLIKFGSTTELYIPLALDPKIAVEQGQYVYGGLTVLASLQGNLEQEHAQRLAQTLAERKANADAAPQTPS